MPTLDTNYKKCFRTREEIQEMRQTRDPITGLREKMVSYKLAEADELKKIELDARKMVTQYCYINNTSWCTRNICHIKCHIFSNRSVGTYI